MDVYARVLPTVGVRGFGVGLCCLGLQRNKVVSGGRWWASYIYRR